MNKPEASAALAAVAPTSMPDVQGSFDARALPIQRVGIRGLRYPVRWQGRTGVLHGVGDWAFSVALPAEQKGTHMSRFHELLQQHEDSGQVLEPASLRVFFTAMLGRLQADSGRIEMAMPFFMRKQAPVTGAASLLDYRLAVVVTGDRESVDVALTVHVPVTSLCPCSKGISDYGAHNQRSVVAVTAHGAGTSLQPESLVELVEAQASSQLYGLLKRADEKYVTEYAYDNPKFVEDLVRDVALAVRALPGITGFAVEAENFESIHNHSAFARLEGQL